MKKQFLLFFLFITSVALNAQLPLFIQDSLDRYINQGMKDWDIPGLSIVIVKDGKVVVMKGYGVKNIDNRAPVDEHTLFMIASNTKLFTATSLAMLENSGKLSLDDHVSKFNPEFKLYDPVTTQLTTLRDLLSHRIGTKTFQGDFTFYSTGISRQEVMKRMQFLKPSQTFRQDFGYCNSCFLTAGQVIPKVAGVQWETFVHDSIIAPLEMNTTMVLPDGIEKQTNIAVPYTTSYSGHLEKVPYDNWNNMAPAASILSNVYDLSHWLMTQLDSGRYNGKQVIPWPAIQKTRDVNIMIRSRKSGVYPMHFTGYGLGLFVADYNGRQIFWHTGGAGGMVSNVCFVPEERLGIAILTNNDNQNFFELLRYQILDAYLSVPFVNRSQQQLSGFKKELQQQVNEVKSWEARVKGQKPELPLTAYAGIYYNELNGNISISQIGNQLKIKFTTKPDLSATLDYMDNGEWLMRYNNILYGVFAVRFNIQNGKVQSITTKQNEFIEYDPYTFVKK